MIRVLRRRKRVVLLRPSDGSASRMTRSAIPVMAHKKVGVSANPREPSKETSSGGGVKRVAGSQYGYFSSERPFPQDEILSWFADRASIDLKSLLLIEKSTLLDGFQSFCCNVRSGILAVKARRAIVQIGSRFFDGGT